MRVIKYANAGNIPCRKECQHILLAVIGFLAQCLVGQCADTAVALQCALAYLEQHAQILIVEKDI